MAKKKQPTKPSPIEYSHNPFSNLKGFAVSGEKVQKEQKQAAPEAPKQEQGTSFAEEMTLLGVQRINSPEAGEEDSAAELPAADDSSPQDDQSEEEQFLQAIGELQVDFSDSYPAEEKAPRASAARMKQLKQGKLAPEASLDLHGLPRAEVADKIRFFLQNADRQDWQTLLVITGRGVHSATGEPVLRKEAERFLSADGHKWVAEWGRAPKKYGGEGALILFLRKKER